MVINQFQKILLVVLRKQIHKTDDIKSKGLMHEIYNMEFIFRKTMEVDIPYIVKMLADDELGSKREDYKSPLPERVTMMHSEISF